MSVQNARYKRWINTSASPTAEFTRSNGFVRVMGVAMRRASEKIYASPTELSDMDFLAGNGITIFQAEAALQNAPKGIEAFMKATSPVNDQGDTHVPWLTTIRDFLSLADMVIGGHYFPGRSHAIK